MAAKDDYAEKVQILMNNHKNIRNIGIVSHIHHGKTVLTDNLAAAAGMMAGDLVGDRMLTWIDDQERERLMTIYGATVTMPHLYGEQKDKYLINLLDTPGHVDFGADVTQAMRAVDGGVVVVCAVEGIMPQTETVLKQALSERVKPVLFINKVDRAIKELQLTPEQLLKRLTKIVVDVNKFIQRRIAPELKGQWIVSVDDGSVAFGSALKKWAISVPSMKRFGVTFKEIIDKCAADEDEELATKSPMNSVVLDMVVQHLPSPIEAQKYRMGTLWTGDIESEMGKQLVNCDVNGHLAGVITKVVYDPHAGMICTARIFSGKLKQGSEIYLTGLKHAVKVQQVTTFIANKRMPIKEAIGGNIVGLVGLSEAVVGDTMCDPDFIIDEFKAIKHIFEPVVTKSIEPKNPQDLPKLIDILKTLNREDPTLKIDINQETGETLVSGLGELHLDAKVERKIREKGVNIIVSPPIVVYRETVTKPGPTIVGKSPNKHNKFWISVRPVSQELFKAMETGDVPDQMIKGKDLKLIEKLQECGIDKDEARSVKLIYNHSILMDTSKGVQYLNEAMELVKEAFKSVVNAGPLAKEPCSGLIVKLEDAELHEDAVHRGPAQVMPAVRNGIFESMLRAEPTLLEPKQVLRVDTPQDAIGAVSSEASNRRGEILNMDQEEFSAQLVVKLPVAEMFGFEPALKSATAGKGFQSLMEVLFEKVPRDVRDPAIKKIRQRKGLVIEEKEEEKK
jgi:elongation factor 2